MCNRVGRYLKANEIALWCNEVAIICNKNFYYWENWEKKFSILLFVVEILQIHIKLASKLSFDSH